MSQRGTEFIERWIRENFHGEVPHRSEDLRPVQWAHECVAAAVRAGISKEEIEADFGDLDKFMEMAITDEGDGKLENSPSSSNSDKGSDV